MKEAMTKVTPFKDEVVIYFSNEDKIWIAHSLRMDQIGTGDRIVDALADLICAAHQILDLAAKDSTVAYLREAPKEIQDLLNKSSDLPGEIFEVAYKRATGKWPKDWSVPEPEKGANAFRAEIDEDLAKKYEGVGCGSTPA